jgi:L-iditol 2-dehydrogenase
MKAAFVANGGGVELREIQRPNLEEGSIMVKMKASGICGTDLEKIRGGYTVSTVLGHEVSGIVSDTKSSLFAKGDSVVPHHHVACGNCYFCMHGAETMCQGFRDSNFDPGGMAFEFRVPEYNVSRGGVHVMRGLSYEEASFAEPLGCCIRAQNKALDGKAEIETCLVVGAGPVGLLHMELLRSRFPEARLVAVDISKTRLDFAEKNEGAIQVDATSSPEFSSDALKHARVDGFDLVIVATGSERAFSESVRCVRKSGTLLLFGAPRKGAKYELDLQSFLLHDLSFLSSYATTEREIDVALKLLESKKINVKKFVTTIFTLERVKEAMDAAGSESFVKVLVTG